MPFFYGNPGSFASIVETLSSSITVNNATTNAMFDLNQTAAANVIDLDNDSTQHGIIVNQDGVLAASKYALYVYSNAAQVNSHLVRIHMDEATSDKQLIDGIYDGVGTGVLFQRNTNSSNSAHFVFIDCNDASSASAGLIIDDENTNSNHGTVRVLTKRRGFQIIHESGALPGIDLNDSAGVTGVSCLWNRDEDGVCHDIDIDANSANACYGIRFDIANAGAGLEYAMRFNGSEIVNAAVGGSQDMKIRISIAGVDYFIPCHTA